MTIKVLAIDDSRTIRALVSRVMEAAGFKCILADDGVQGVARFAEEHDGLFGQHQAEQVFDLFVAAEELVLLGRGEVVQARIAALRFLVHGATVLASRMMPKATLFHSTQ